MNIYKKFESLTAFETYINTNETQPAFLGRESSKREAEDNDDFRGTKNWEEAEDMMMYGDKENAKKIEKGGLAQERLKNKLTENRRQIYSDVTGFAVNVPNYLAGVPTAMINARQIRVKNRVINLVYNISVSGSVSASTMQDVAIKMLSAIMRIEARGVRVNLYVCDLSVSNKQEIGWLLRIKSSGQKLDVIKTAYPLTNPSMLRRHSFRFTEITKGVKECFVGGYGRPTNDCERLFKSCGLRDAKILHFSTMRQLDVDGIVNKIIG